MKLRIWRLGSYERQIYPTANAIDKFKKCLLDQTDIVHASDVKFDDLDFSLEETEMAELNLVGNDNFPLEKFKQDFYSWWREWVKNNLRIGRNK